MEADRVLQDAGERFDMELQMALQNLRESCACPDPIGAFDPALAQMDRERLQPINDPSSEAAKTYRDARDAFTRGIASPDQRALIIHTETLNEIFGRQHDRPHN